MKKIITLIAVFMASLQVQAQSLYGDMEVWRNYSVGFSSTQLQSVRGWNCPDSLVFLFGPLVGSGPFSRQLFKTTDAHSGNYAAMVMTATQGSFGQIPGIMTNATINIDMSAQDFSLSGGTPVNGRINYLNAWIKYIPKNGDSANVVASAILTGAASDGSDSILATAVQTFAETPNYTLVSIPFTYTDPNAIPDAIQVIFTSSGSQASDSSKLYVDDVSYTLFPASVNTVAGKEVIKLYPNPVGNALNLEGPAGQKLVWKATAMNGQVIATESFTGSKQIDVSAYAPGTYLYTVTDDQGKLVQQQKFTIER